MVEVVVASGDALGPCAPRHAEHAQSIVGADALAAHTASIASTSTEVLKVCECSGNCGWVLCSRAANQRLRQKIVVSATSNCTRVCKPGRRLCSWCECESHGCLRPRNKAIGSKRWCVLCAPTRATKRHQYVTAYGVWPKSLLGDSLILKFVARTGFLPIVCCRATFAHSLISYRAASPSRGRPSMPLAWSSGF